MDRISFHLLLVFQSDAAETQRFYISNGFKKPNRVSIRQFVQRVQQLNGYLDLVPCLFYSEQATKLTKVVELFDDAELAGNILQMVPKQWQDQYKLTGGTVPQSVHKLFKAGTSGGDSSKKWMVSFNDRIPKKSRKEAKHCAL